MNLWWLCCHVFAYTTACLALMFAILCLFSVMDDCDGH